MFLIMRGPDGRGLHRRCGNRSMRPTMQSEGHWVVEHQKEGDARTVARPELPFKALFRAPMDERLRTNYGLGVEGPWEPSMSRARRRYDPADLGAGSVLRPPAATPAGVSPDRKGRTRALRAATAKQAKEGFPETAGPLAGR